MKHKHADVLIAIAEGKEVEWKPQGGQWLPMEFPQDLNPMTHPHCSFRVKPEPEAEWKQKLRQAAREGKEVQNKCGNTWLILNQNYEGWDLPGKESDYRIVPKTVTRWNWAIKGVGGWIQSTGFYTEQEAKSFFDKPHFKLEYTRTEFPE